MARGKQTYDADSKAKERAERTFLVGGRTFYAAKRTVGVIRAWLESVPEEIADADPDAPVTRDQSVQRVGILNRQLAILLRERPTITDADEGEAAPELLSHTDDPMDPDAIAQRASWFDEHLDVEDAGQMMEMLSPSEEEQKAAAGN